LLSASTQLVTTMVLTALDKGKGKAAPETHEEPSESDSSSSSSSSPDSDTSYSESEDEITPEYLESLLEKARQSAAASGNTRKSDNHVQEEDMLILSESAKEYVPSHPAPCVVS
jgi:hypothetical protein